MIEHRHVPGYSMLNKNTLGNKSVGLIGRPRTWISAEAKKLLYLKAPVTFVCLLTDYYECLVCINSKQTR